tara:strand:- start:234 stop:821 length:588 start_codon:yes stop_codon:yes gene_type:complete
LFPNKEHIIHHTIPYIDGGASISRTARVFPTYLIFKPAMFLTAYLLIRYWLYIKSIIFNLHGEHKNLRKILIFGISSAICLIIHSIFLGIKFDYDLYKLFRRVIMLFFIIFEVVAQAYLVITLYSIKDKLANLINAKFLKLKAILVSILIIVMIVSIPIVSMPGNKHIKHALEWDFFLGVILFYVLTFFMWKKKE